YEEITFSCGDTEHHLMQHCHFARNDPGHQCFGAWNLKRKWRQPASECEDCIRKKQYN
ncbi:hypothetical protein BDW02DRAFT_482161, partial [Decorospora gaudefroyi]